MAQPAKGCRKAEQKAVYTAGFQNGSTASQQLQKADPSLCSGRQFRTFSATGKAASEGHDWGWRNTTWAKVYQNVKEGQGKS
jgi:hypothetical protein